MKTLSLNYNSEDYLCISGIYVNEDLCPATLDIRRSKMDELRETRWQGKDGLF